MPLALETLSIYKSFCIELFGKTKKHLIDHPCLLLRVLLLLVVLLSCKGDYPFVS